jgi:hypothetical protein
VSSFLILEFFDTDASSSKHRLEIPLRTPGAFRVTETNMLQADHSDGTVRYFPLANAKQYFEKGVPAQLHQTSAH